MNADSLFKFFSQLKINTTLPEGVEILNPYTNNEVLNLNTEFYNKYYNDDAPRIMLLGINPGRFGAGITGLSFTDPVTLENNLGIMNSFDKKPELSATFIHEVIKAYGGPEEFYGKFLVTAVSPLGFVKNGVNINYYDQKDLQEATTPFIKECLLKQFELTGKTATCVSIGQGKNISFLEELNKELKLFKQIIPLGHPRWIMQYRRKELKKHIEQYVDVLKNI